MSLRKKFENVEVRMQDELYESGTQMRILDGGIS